MQTTIRGSMPMFGSLPGCILVLNWLAACVLLHVPLVELSDWASQGAAGQSGNESCCIVRALLCCHNDITAGGHAAQSVMCVVSPAFVPALCCNTGLYLAQLVEVG